MQTTKPFAKVYWVCEMLCEKYNFQVHHENVPLARANEWVNISETQRGDN